VAVADVNTPGVAVDGDVIARHDAHEAARHFWNQAWIVGGTRADVGQRLRVGQAVAGKVAHRRVTVRVYVRTTARACVDGIAPQRPQPRGDVIGHRHPQRHLPALAQPMRQPHVVGMHVGDDDAQNRQAVERLVKHLLPQRFDLIARHAAIDHRPAVAASDAVAQQPQVDVVQRKRQRHAQPPYAVGKLNRHAGRGQQLAPWVGQFLFVGIHGAHLTQPRSV